MISIPAAQVRLVSHAFTNACISRYYYFLSLNNEMITHDNNNVNSKKAKKPNS